MVRRFRLDKAAPANADDLSHALKARRSGRVSPPVDRPFRHNIDQVLEFARYLDWIYLQQVSMLGDDPDIQKIILFRSVNVSWLEHGRGCTVGSLTEALRIPRETVRRKCAVLVRASWLAHVDGEYRPGPRAADIPAFVDTSIDRLLVLADRIRALDQ